MMRCLVELDQRINHFRSVQLSGFRVFDGPRRDRVERRAFQVFGTSNVAGVPHVRPDFSSCVPCRADGRIESCVAAGLAVSWHIVRAAWTASAALGGCGRAWPVDTGKEEMCSDSRKRSAPTAVRGGDSRSAGHPQLTPCYMGSMEAYWCTLSDGSMAKVLTRL